ncbi:apyrase-like [Ochlerotatus camptorhynchus]|uniref:apyrase-like n=1 Tax=Ochlerotatus camptorhynchus TaxID=644619 RepID=UPI0031DCA98F
MMQGKIVLLLLSFFISSVKCSNFKLKIIHFNDLHARYDEVTNRSMPCAAGSKECIAGVARLVTTIEKLKKENTNHLVLNAGDAFQGTVWYSLLKWNVTQRFMNIIKADAMVLGNHEFDDSIEGLIPFLNATKDVTPVVVSNLIIPKKNTTEFNALRSLVRHDPIKLKVGGETIGIIGVIYDETDKITNTGSIKFKNYISSVRKQATELKMDGVNKIIVLSHCGIFEDKKIAEQAGQDIDIIVGGHSHSLLYNGVAPSKHAVFDKYPMVIDNGMGNKVLIVQAFCHGKYVGNIDLTFDASGKIVSYEGQPIYQGNSIEKNTTVETVVQDVKKEVESKSSVRVGETEIELNNDCRVKECSLGSVLANAYIWHYRNARSSPTIAMIHPGNFRTILTRGGITRGELLTAIPFSSTANRISVSGSTIKKAIEYGVTLSRRCTFNTPQISGIKVSVDFAKDAGNRTKVDVKQGDAYVELDETKTYDVVVNSYMIKGGDGFDMFKNATVKGWGPTDAETFEQYINGTGIIKATTLREPRIEVLHEEQALKDTNKCTN